MTRFHAICFFAVALTSCSARDLQTAQSVDLGAEVTLAPGSSAEFKPAGVVVQFVGITTDSRCPQDVICMWAGEVKVQLSIRLARQPPTSYEILEGEHAHSGDYRVTVVRVRPEPIASAKIPPKDYRAALQLQKS